MVALRGGEVVIPQASSADIYINILESFSPQVGEEG